jgi:hypothetical protein
MWWLLLVLVPVAIVAALLVAAPGTSGFRPFRWRLRREQGAQGHPVEPEHRARYGPGAWGLILQQRDGRDGGGPDAGCAQGWRAGR